MKLENDQHERFCQEYIVDLNQTKAAERAEYSKKTAPQQASRLLSNVKIQERIAELKKIRSERTQVTQDMVLRELAILALSDFENYGEIVNEFGIERLKLKLFKDMPPDITRAIQSVSEHVTKDGVQLKFKLHGKEKALELIMRHLGMLVDKFDIGDKLKQVLYEISEKYLPKVGDEKK